MDNFENNSLQPRLNTTSLLSEFNSSSILPDTGIFPDPLIGNVLSLAEEYVIESLEQFSTDADFPAKMHLAFGDSWEEQTAQSLIADITNHQALPGLTIVSDQVLGAQGAFGAGTIYLSHSFINQNLTNPQAIGDVLLEEIGHYLDSQLNPVDSPGDEGRIFAALVQNQPLDESQLAILKAEDDSDVLQLDGETIPVEYSLEETGIFTVDNTGQFTIDFLFDAGSYKSELAVVNLTGMENLTPGSPEFIQEAARRALSNSTLGYIILADQTEGAKFGGELAESNKNQGNYLNVKTFTMNPGDRFIFMMVPNGTMEEVLDNPGIDNNQRPLFSIAQANPDNGIQMTQLATGAADGGVFAMEDLRRDQNSDADYNDIIFHVRGAAGKATPLAEVVNPGKPWDSTTIGQQLLEYARTNNIFEEQTPGITASLANDTGTSQTDGITSNPEIQGRISSQGNLQAGFNGNLVDISALLQTDGTFSLTKETLTQINNGSLADGEYSLKLRLSDLQGNLLSSSEVNFTLDTSNPILLLDTPISGGNHSSKSRLIGSISDDGSGLFSSSYSLDGQELSPLAIDNQGNFDQTIDTTGLTQGNHNVIFSLVDVAGNSTQTSTDFTVSDDFTIGGDGIDGWGIKTEDSIILGEQNSFVTQTSVEIELGQNQGTRELGFTIDAQFDTTNTNTQSADRLLVYLVDTANPNNTLLDSGEPGTPVFSLSENNAEFTPGLVSYDGNRVKIDLTSLADRTSGSLIFQLINHDGDIGSIVRITDITNTVDSEGVANPLFPTDTYRAEIGEPLNLDTFDTTNDVELFLSNVQLDSNTGTYTADLQVRNNGSTTLGRELAVVLTNLPDGVTLNNSSGTHAGSSPYINLSHAIPPGGLNPQGISDAVQIVFDNPSLTRFELQPVFLTGGEEQPPQLAPIASQRVMPGERLEIPLIATDPNGDPITFSLDADTPLPNGELTGDGTLIFTPSPDDVGTYNFTVVASAGGVDVTQDVTLVVEPDPITTTRISGVIQNTDQAPLGGVVIELGGVQTTTDSNGYFQLEFDGELPSDTLKIRGEQLTGDEAYPFIAEKLPLVLEHEVYQGVNNVISRPIYLPALDTANAVTVDPNTDTTVTTSTIPGASVFVAAGSLDDQQGNPFTGGLGITEVPPDLTPAALPENLRPDMVVTIQPGEMVFNTPAPLALPNRAGYAPGLEMDLWSINPNTGLFDKVGTGRVSDDGTVIETIEGGIRNSSWHFFTPPAPPLNDPNNDPRNIDDSCEYCEVTQPINSEVELHSGGVRETHNLVTYQSLGATRGLTLRYDSLRADPRHIVHFGYDDVPANSDNLLVASLEVKQGDFTYEAPGVAPGEYGLSGGENFWSLPASGGEVDAALQVDMGDLDSGRYEYELTAGLQIFTGDSFNGSSTTTTGELINVNRVNSAFGSGWELSGWQEIVENDDGSVLLIDGDGSQFLFQAPTTPGGAYIAPPADTSSTLERLADGTFRRTMKDQTVYQFNGQNQLELVEDANDNQTRYVYNTAGQLTQIIDPAGLVTQFTYTGNRVTAITDPAGRITQLSYDGGGNLVKITDPDNSSRSWEYDNSHRMTAAIDKRGNRGEDVYDFAGRVETAIRPDGSVVQVDAVQTQGLYRPEQTINPFNAPVANGLGDASASYVDGNGNVVQTLLDQAGQEVSSRDGAGFLPSVERDGNNLVTTSTNARGNVTNYTYDENGNVLTISDEISRQSQETGGAIDNSNLFPDRIYETGNNPQQIVTGDFNGDGELDLAVINHSRDVSILLADGPDSFSSPTNFDAGHSPISVAVGDVNGDGNLDLAFANDYEDVSILLGDGQGSFSSPSKFIVDDENEITSVALGDVNGDGNLDLAVTSFANDGRGRVSILLGDGQGSFGTPTDLSVESDAKLVSLGDLDSDGDLDMAVAQGFGYGSEDILSVFLNNGDGDFAPKTDYALPDDPEFIAMADVNEDDQLDLVTANSNEDSVSVLLNDGNGNFANKTDYAVGREPESIVIGDVNGDGKLDLVTANRDGNSVSVLLNDGDGTFAAQTEIEYESTREPRSAVLVDMNSDGKVDILTANSREDTISVVWNNGDGTFSSQSATTNYSTGNHPISVAIGDVNGDRVTDFVTANYSDNTVSVGLGNGDGTFSSTSNYAFGNNPYAVTLGDVNADGNPDIVTANAASDNVSVLLGNGDGTFGAKTDYAVGDTPISVVLGDINSDGSQDIVTANRYDNNVSVLLGNGDGTFGTKTDYAVGENPIDVALGDVNGDGSLDLAFANTGNNTISILLNDGNGVFTGITNYQVRSSPRVVILSDVNSDNRLDLVTPGLILLGNGDGTFGTTTTYSVSHLDDLALADVNGDGNVDLLSSGGNRVSVLLGDGFGNFASDERLVFEVGNGAESIAVDDFDDDGDLDFITTSSINNNVSVRLNNTIQKRTRVGTGEQRYTYDPVFNQVTSFTDELGRTTLYEIDPLTGNMLSTTRVVGEVGGDDDVVTSYTYTSDGQVDLMTDALGRVTDYDYDDLGRLVRVTDALGTVDEAVQQFEYDAAGNQTAVIDENGNRTEFVYDAMNMLVQVIEADPDGSGPLESPVTSYTYDEDGNQTAVTDARGNVSSSEYDSMGRLVKTINAQGKETLYSYDEAGNLAFIIDELGRKTQYRYDARNRLVETIYADGSTQQQRYDFDDNLVATIDGNGNRTNMVYDARGRLIRVIDPDSNVTQFEYDPTNQRIATVDANNHKTEYEYDDLGRQVEVTDALGNSTTTTYNKVGNAIAQTDELGNTTSYTYDNRHRLTTVTDALGNTATTQYDEVGNITAITDELGRTTQYTYDGLNRQTSIVDPLNRTTTYDYDATYNLTAITDELGRTTTYSYDVLNRQNIVTNALGDTATTEYDAVGNITAITDELGRTTQFTYDERNRQITITDPLGHTTTREYDNNGNSTAIIDALGQTTSYSYDALDRQTTATDALNQTTTTTYDAVGNVLSVTDAEGNTTSYTYDELDRLIAETNQLGSTRSYGYDGFGNLITTTDRNGRVRSYTYDALNRQSAENWLDGSDNIIHSINYTYDAASQLTAVNDQDSSYGYTYDGAGQLIRIDNAGTPGVANVVLDYTYDGVGNGRTVTDTINSVQFGIEEFTYDELNRVTRITQSGNGVADKRVDMTYDAASQMTGITRYGDLAGTQLVAESNYTYDAGSRLTQLTHSGGNGVLTLSAAEGLADYTWEYDEINRITQFTSPDGSSSYNYDATNQLVGSDYSYQDDESYTYDANGNRTNDGYDTGADNRLLSDGKYNYSYDDEGNRTQRVEIATGEVTEYSWDYRNRLTQVIVKDAAGNVVKAVEYTYDVFDRRIAKEVDPDGDGAAISEVERFVYDGEHIALTFDGDGNLTHRYLHGAGIDQVLADENAQGGVLWALTDNQGTVRDVVDAAGVVVNHITYDSFGGVTGESNTAVDFRFGYTGREFDEETGLYYYRARYYDAATGRFISQDPIGFEAGDGNLYRYVFNSPTNFNDYSGDIAIPVAIVGGGLFLAAGGLLILSNPQAQEVIQELPRRLPNPLKFFDNILNPDLDPNNINDKSTPDFLPDPLVGGGFRLGIHDFNPNDINIHDGISVRFSDTLTFPLGDFECLFPPFLTSSGDFDPPDSPVGDLKLVNEKWLKKKGIEPHEIKDNLPGPLKEFDIYKDRDNNLWGLRKPKYVKNAEPEYLGNIDEGIE
ncbi:MAG: FG-GAP-like repeat-containing protein [Calothrix sp. MO_167.B42]|nr:FG-GAP-like repeat-containing protein [Calothrix sp. MO_167.B42]